MTHASHPGRTRAAPDAAEQHRRRLLAPLLHGRAVLECGHVRNLAQAAGPRLAQLGAEVAVDLTPMDGAAAQARARAMLGMIVPEGIAIVVSHDIFAAAELRALARHHAHYTQRLVNGSLFRPAEFDGGRIAVLRDPPPDFSLLHIYLFASRPLPPLNAGLLECAEAPPEAPVSTLDEKLPALPEEARHPTGRSREGQAASLAGRLLAQEARLMASLARQRQLEATQAESRAGQSGGWFEPPTGRHGWRLAEQSGPAAASSDPYDRRVDDPVIHAARAGEAFFAKYRLGLAGDGTARAAAALAKRPNLLAPASGEPDVSIVIPVYGQAAYTLNCLDSLFAQLSRYSAEIIIVDDCSPDETATLLPNLPQIRYHRQARNGGFIASCNAGGALARGDFIVMLNNDTRVVEGWLDALIGSFSRFPRAGLVGSKMLYADGSLQEAGGIIWRDGSAWNYGRNDDPNRPHYAYARQVDYISGCSIALRRSTWNDMKGFDPHFTPAYCEDADLCLRVVQAGGEVWYQPQSRVVHYEGKTSGTDTGKGVKAYQVVNAKKLFLRWRTRLAAHRPNGEAPYAEKDRAARTRMLVIDATTPTPDQDAGSLQTVLGLQSCRALGYATTFVPQDNFLFQPGYTTDLQAAGIDCAYAPYELGMESYLRRYGALFDVVMVYRATVLDKILPLIRRHAPQAVLLYHVADLHFLRLERQAALEGDELLASDAAAMRARELALVQAADCTITHSRFEADLLADLVPAAPVAVWPLMYPFHGTQKDFASRRDVVFLGGYRHSPNVDAVEFFAASILPALREAEPGLRFIAAGANPTADVAALACDHVQVTGLISDLRDVLDSARVFVCPLRVGAGVKGKIMTALSYGIPVVTTSVGIEGSGLIPGTHVLVADDAESFARETLRLYRDAALWQRLSQAGQALMRGEFSPDGGAAFLESAIAGAWAHKLGVAAA